MNRSGRFRTAEQVAASQRRYREKHPDRVRARSLARKSSQKYRATTLIYRRALRAKMIDSGLTTKGTLRIRSSLTVPANKLWQSNALQAWTYWVTVRAPQAWLDAYYAAGRQWRDHRVPRADRYRIRYHADEAFRAREAVKLERLKPARSALIAGTDDGSLGPDVVRRLFAFAKCCYYCHGEMIGRAKSLDHKTPLSRGGAHSITNVVVACKTCNFSKGSKTEAEFLEYRAA